MSLDGQISRRQFVLTSTASAVAVATGVLVGNRLFAEPTQLAARVDDIPNTNPMTPALQLATAALKSLQDVKDYTATFTKRELVGRKMVDAQMDLKLRQQPFSVYLKFVKPSAGREVLYVAGQNDDKIKAHDVGLAGLAGTLSLDIDGRLAMSDNRYPITMLGMQTMVTELLEQWLLESKMTGVTVNFFQNARINNLSCKAIEIAHRDRSQGAKYALTRLYVATDSGLPVRIQNYDFPAKSRKQSDIVEDYLYTNIKTNVGLSDLDFSVDNPSYRF